MHVSYSLLVAMALGVSSHGVTIAEDDWKAERKAAESEPPAICASFAALVRGEIAKARAIKAALKEQRNRGSDQRARSGSAPDGQQARD